MNRRLTMRSTWFPMFPNAVLVWLNRPVPAPKPVAVLVWAAPKSPVGCDAAVFPNKPWKAAAPQKISTKLNCLHFTEDPFYQNVSLFYDQAN